MLSPSPVRPSSPYNLHITSGTRNQERCKVIMQVRQRGGRGYHPDISIWPNNDEGHVVCVDAKALISSTAHSLGDVGIIQ